MDVTPGLSALVQLSYTCMLHAMINSMCWNILEVCVKWNVIMPYIIGAEVRKYVGCSLYCQHKSKKKSKQNPGTPFFLLGWWVQFLSYVNRFLMMTWFSLIFLFLPRWPWGAFIGWPETHRQGFQRSIFRYDSLSTVWCVWIKTNVFLFMLYWWKSVGEFLS